MLGIFRTLIKKDHKFSDNDYVKGRITGIEYIVCFNGDIERAQDLGFAHVHFEDGILLKTICTKRQYEKFSKLVETMYPGLCEFDYKGEVPLW